MNSGLPYERMLEESLRGELRLSNAHLPGQQKSLADLLLEEYPTISGSDGSTHLFKRKELQYISGLLEEDEKSELYLPVIIEVTPGQKEISIICRGGMEEKLVSAVLDMNVTTERGRIKIYGPQLAELRRKLKTTTQYLFSLRIVR